MDDRHTYQGRYRVEHQRVDQAPEDLALVGTIDHALEVLEERFRALAWRADGRLCVIDQDTYPEQIVWTRPLPRRTQTCP